MNDAIGHQIVFIVVQGHPFYAATALLVLLNYFIFDTVALQVLGSCKASRDSFDTV